MLKALSLLLLWACVGGDPEPVLASGTTTDSGTSGFPQLASFQLTGTVVDDAGQPVPDAMVLFGGRPDTMISTGPDGHFEIWYTPEEPGEPAIVAAKIGYRAVGDEFFGPGDVLTLVLRRISEVDNEAYVYQDPGDGEYTLLEDCTHCHTSFVKDFLTSGHAEAARNPLLHDLYAGVSAGHDQASCEASGGVWAAGREPGSEASTVDKCYLGGGVLPDLNADCGGPGQPRCDGPGGTPTAFGACADCHAPGIDGVAGGRNLHEAHGLAYDIGVHCDVCHKVRDVDLSLPPGVGQRLVMGRPSEPGDSGFAWDPVYYGPLLDVPNVVMGGSYQPKFEQSMFCAGCHEQAQQALVPGTQLADRWPDGLPVHTTYSEWQAGPYSENDTPCQHCHMPADPTMTNAVDITVPEKTSITFGFPRDPEDVRRHTFRGPLQGGPRLIDEAVYLSLVLGRVGDSLEVEASLTNIGCGHAVPTGEPMRSLVLVVEASGQCGSLRPTGGMTVPDIGGASSSGVVGIDLAEATSPITWSGHGTSVGDVLRVVRPSGIWDDYPATGAFASMSPQDKGMEILEPVGEAVITAIDGDNLTTDLPLSMQPGDVVYSGSPWVSPVDGEPATALAGLPGYAFAKVLLDNEGKRHVPHYRAVDIASDNRIGPGQSARTTHRFEVPKGCADVQVDATLLYRPVPIALASERGWDTNDYVIARATSVLTP